jgi:isoleucyl-tRNA synthetase
MPELERWVIHRLSQLDKEVRQGFEVYDFNRVYQTLFAFCTSDLSAFYFDIRKDVLYCDPKDSLRRRAARTVLDILFRHLTVWLSPVLCFTMEEVFLTRHPSDEDSIHLHVMPDVPADWADAALAAKWQQIRRLRRAVTGALEVERREKRIGASLEASVDVVVADDRYVTALEGLNLAEISITSEAFLRQGEAPPSAFRLEDVTDIAVVVNAAPGRKCERCWMILPEVGSDPDVPATCGRCASAVKELRKNHG